MAEKVKSKTDVSARAGNKNKAQCCSNCGNKVEVVLSVTPDGKKKMSKHTRERNWNYMTLEETANVVGVDTLGTLCPRLTY